MDDAISLAVAYIVARHHGARLRYKAVDLRTELFDLLSTGGGRDADIDNVDLALVSGDWLEERQSENDRAVLHPSVAIDNPNDRQFCGLKLKFVADFFLKNIRSSAPE